MSMGQGTYRGIRGVRAGRARPTLSRPRIDDVEEPSGGHQPADPGSRQPPSPTTTTPCSANIEQVIQGKPDVIELVLLCLVSEGHLLIEDVPGVGKTSLAKALAASIDGTFGRLQFTPDLLPTDVVGLTVWNRNTSEFEFRPGPVFGNIVLADEINRASPKTQSALLEAMAEAQVTVDGTTYQLAEPVHGHRHPEPDRARGHLPAARVAARPVPHAGVGGLPVDARASCRSSTPTATTTPSTTSAP